MVSESRAELAQTNEPHVRVSHQSRPVLINVGRTRRDDGEAVKPKRPNACTRVAIKSETCTQKRQKRGGTVHQYLGPEKNLNHEKMGSDACKETQVQPFKTTHLPVVCGCDSSGLDSPSQDIIDEA